MWIDVLKKREPFFSGIYSLIEASRLLYDASSTSKWCRVTRLFKDIYSQMKAVSQEELSRGKRPAVKRPARRIYCLLSALRTRRELSSWNGLKEKNHGDQRTDMVDSQIKQRSTEKTCRKQLCFPRTCNVFRQRSAVQQLALRSNIKEETRTPLEMIIATRLLHSSRSLFKLLIDSSCGRLCTRCTFPFRLLASFLKSYVRYRWASLSQSAPSIPPGIGCFFWRFRRIPHGRYFRCKNQHISVDYINLVDASEGENRQRLATVTFDSPGEFFIKFSAFGDATECPSD